MNHKYMLVQKSENRILGQVAAAVYASRSTCPKHCPFRNTSSCYAENPPTSIHWDRCDKEGMSLEGLLEGIRKLPESSYLRLNVAGDLPGDGHKLSAPSCIRIAEAIEDQHITAWGYTRYHMCGIFGQDLARHNRAVHQIMHASCPTLTINNTIDSPALLQELNFYNIPTVIVTPTNYARPSADYELPKHLQPIICPQKENKGNHVTKPIPRCITECKKCMTQNRKISIGFPPHGAGRLAVNSNARSNWASVFPCVASFDRKEASCSKKASTPNPNPTLGSARRPRPCHRSTPQTRSRTSTT